MLFKKALSSISNLIHVQTWLHPRCLTCSTLGSVVLLLKVWSEARVGVRFLKGKSVCHYPKKRKKWCQDQKGIDIYHEIIHMSKGRGFGLIDSKVFPCSKIHSFMICSSLPLSKCNKQQSQIPPKKRKEQQTPRDESLSIWATYKTHYFFNPFYSCGNFSNFLNW